MLEVQENSIAPVTRVVQFPEPTSMKTQDNITLRGEISDLKSYLGFREPGFGDLLRSPAANSIRAGVPPVLVITDREGRQKIVILLDAKQQAVGSSILGMVAVPVEIQGTLWNWGGTPFLAADPATYRKLSFWD